MGGSIEKQLFKNKVISSMISKLKKNSYDKGTQAAKKSIKENLKQHFKDVELNLKYGVNLSESNLRKTINIITGSTNDLQKEVKHGRVFIPIGEWQSENTATKVVQKVEQALFSKEKMNWTSK